MELKKYLLAGGIASVLVLGACNGDEGEDTEGNEGMDTPAETEDVDETEVEENVEEDVDVDVDTDAEDADADADDEA